MWKSNFRYHKLQTFMLFIIVMLSTLALCGAISILVSLDGPFHELADECQSATASVWGLESGNEATELLKEEFEELDEVDHVYMMSAHYINEEMSSNGKIIDSFTFLTEYTEDIFGTVRYVEGQPLSESYQAEYKCPLSEKECAVPACICIEYELNVGDTIQIKFPEETVEYTIRAIYAEPYGSTTAYENYLLVRDLPDSVEAVKYIRLYGKEGITGQDIEEAYRNHHEGKMNCTINSLEEEIDNNLFSGTILGSILLAIGGILLVVSGLIINFMVRNTMINEAKSIAIYKTIGYSSKNIIRMYLTFYFVVISAGSICGNFGASIFVHNILGSMYKNIGAKSSGNIVLPAIFCYFIIVIFVLSIIYLNMRRTKNVKPVLALNNMNNGNSTKSKMHKGDSKMQFSPIGIAMRTMIRNKKGAIGIVITSIVTIFAMNFAIISIDVTNTLKENNDYWLGIEDCEIMISVGEGVEAGSIEELLKDKKEIIKMIPSNLVSYKFSLDWEKGIDFTQVQPFVYDDYDEASYEVLEGRNPENAGEIAIANKVALNTDKKIGDYLNVNMNDKTYSLLITGIYQTYYSMGKSARMVTDTFYDNDIPFHYDTISVYLDKGTDPDEYINVINNAIGNNGKATLRTDMFSSIMTLIMRPQQKAIPPMTVLILLIGATNIFCSVLLKNANSEKTNGIYKSIGYSTGHLILSNVWYVVMIAICSLALAVPSVMLLYPYIMKLSLSVFGLMEYRVHYDAIHLIEINIAVIITFIVSTVISSKSLYKVNIKNLIQD